MEAREHFHIDWFEIRNGEVWPTRSSEPLDKSTAGRRFAAVVEELRCVIGPMAIVRGEHPLFPGSVLRAESKRLIVVLSRCDCGLDDGVEAH